MEFKDIISVSGKSGLYKIESPRKEGVIAAELENMKKTFISARKHSFTPLENIGIFLVSGDTVELSEVLNKINKQETNRPTNTDNADDIRLYFDEVLPNYDEDKFKMSDMKKVLQWFHILRSKDLLEGDSSSTEEE